MKAKVIGPPSHLTIYNKWYDERIQRDRRAPSSLPKDSICRTWHRKCPTCGGSGEVMVYMGSRIDPPDYGDCPLCDGWGRVDQENWEQGIHDLEAEAAYWDSVAEERYYREPDEYSHQRQDNPEPRDLL